MNAIRELIRMCRTKEGYLFRSEMDKVNAAAAELAAMEAVIEAARAFLEWKGFPAGVSKVCDDLAAALADYDKKGS